MRFLPIAPVARRCLPRRSTLPRVDKSPLGLMMVLMMMVMMTLSQADEGLLGMMRMMLRMMITMIMMFSLLYAECCELLPLLGFP